MDRGSTLRDGGSFPPIEDIEDIRHGRITDRRPLRVASAVGERSGTVPGRYAEASGKGPEIYDCAARLKLIAKEVDVLPKRFRLAFIRMVAVICAMLLLVPGGATLLAQQPPPLPPPGQTLSPDQLDDLVAPIALYPDPLLSQILVAATYPLELVQASQWLQRTPGLTGAALTQAAQQQNWDPSVQALAVFPDIIQRLTQDITWTTNLGNTFLAQQPDVMDAVQRMRFKAEQAGKLPSTSQQRVTTTTESGQPIVEIEPADPQVIYVPQYDPVYIWGPPLYYPYAQWYYPPLVGGVFLGFGVGIAIGAFFGGGWGGWGGWGWRPGWSNHTVIINNNFIHRYNLNPNHITALHGTAVWAHDAFHRQGVPYPSHALADHFGAGVRENLRPRDLPGPVRGSPASGGQVRGVPAPAAAPGERMGNRQIAPSAPGRNPSAFGGVESGGMSRMHSDHGFSSIGPARSAPMRAAPASRPSGAPARGAPMRAAPASRAGDGGHQGGGHPRGGGRQR